jgi:hypothetical protein
MYCHRLNDCGMQRAVFFTDLLFFKSIDHVPSVDDFAEHGVFHVQVHGLGVSDEELGSVGVGALVNHAQHAAGTKSQVFTKLVSKVLAEYALASLASACRVAALNHERLYVSVECTAIVVTTCAQSKKIFSSFWDQIAKNFELDVAKRRVQSHRHVSVVARVNSGFCGRMFFGFGNEHAIEQPDRTFSVRSGCILNSPTHCKILLEATAIACPPHWVVRRWSVLAWQR